MESCMYSCDRAAPFWFSSEKCDRVGSYSLTDSRLKRLQGELVPARTSVLAGGSGFEEARKHHRRREPPPTAETEERPGEEAGEATVILPTPPRMPETLTIEAIQDHAVRTFPQCLSDQGVHFLPEELEVPASPRSSLPSFEPTRLKQLEYADQQAARAAPKSSPSQPMPSSRAQQSGGGGANPAPAS